MDIPSLFMIPSAVSSGKVHSVFPNLTDADFDFNRDSDATRVNSEGLIERVGFYSAELVTNGGFDTDSNWTKGTGVTILNGKANWNNTGNNFGVTQNGIFTIGKTYKVEFTVSNYISGTVRVRFPFIGTRIQANGTYTFYGVATTDGLYLQGETQFGNPQFSIDNVSVVEVLGDRARLNYEIEGGLVNTKPSLLLEPQSTNLITYSEDYSQSSWTKLNAQVSRTDETSPDGNNTNVFNLTGTNGNLFVGGTTGVEYTISVYIKSNNKNKDKFKLRLGNNISTEYEATDEWIRYVFTSTPTTGVLGITTSSSPDNEFDLLVWGFQLEQLSYATSYIPTNGSTQTRAAETCTGAGTSSILPSEEGILYAELKNIANDGTNKCIAISNGLTVNNRVTIVVGTGDNVIRPHIIKDGVAVFDQTTNSFNTVDNFVKIAVRYKTNDFACWVNGTQALTDTSGDVPTGLNTLKFDVGNNTLPFYGKIRDVRVYNTKEMTDSEVDILLTKITS